MSIKLQIINQTIRKIEKRLSRVDFILTATPLSDIINLQKNTIETVQKMEIGPASLAILSEAIKKEKALFRLAKLQNYPALIDEKIKLESELRELLDEKWLIENRESHKKFLV